MFYVAKRGFVFLSFSLGVLFWLLSQATAFAAPSNHECAHLLWQLNATQNDASDAALSNDAIRLRYAAAEFLFRNESKTNKITDPRAIDLFKSIADGQIKEPAEVLGTGLYDSLFISLKSSSEFQSRLKSEEKFVAQCRENVLASQKIIWDLPTNVNDLFVKPKPWLQSLKEKVPFAATKKPTPEEIQTSIASLVPAKKLAIFKKTVARGITPITVAEAIRLTHIFASDEESTVIKLLLPSIFNDFSFYAPLDAIAMLKTLNSPAAKILVQNLPVFLSAPEFESILKTVPQVSQVLPTLLLTNLDVNREDLLKRVRDGGPSSFPLYVGFYAKVSSTEDTQKLLSDLASSRSLSTSESEELKTSVTFVRDLLTENDGNKESSSVEESFAARMKAFAGISDLVSRNKQLYAYARTVDKITDTEFAAMFRLIPKDLNWGHTNGSAFLKTALAERNLESFSSNTSEFVRDELLISWFLFQKINRIESAETLISIYNEMMVDVKRCLEVSFTDEKGEEDTFNKKFKNAVVNLFDTELTRILDPKKTNHRKSR